MTNKITKVEMFTMIKALSEVKANADMVAFIDHEIELLQKKSGSKKATKTQVENESIKTVIIETLSSIGCPATVTEIQNSCSALAELSNQKVSALLRQLVESNTVERIADKKTTRFALVENDSDNQYLDREVTI